MLLAFALPFGPAAAQLLPTGFFDHSPTPGAQAEIEADFLTYNAQTTVISAEGGVVMLYDGYEIAADRLSYNQTTGEMLAEGNVKLRDPEGNFYEADRIEVTDSMKRAFVESLTLTTAEGALIKATDVDYAKELETVLTDASYSPCGLCIDKKGRRIGWKVNASKFIHDEDRALVFLENAGLELLGIPVAWIPWLVLPDPSQPRAQGFRVPKVDYDPKYGVRLDVPYFVPISKDIDLMLTPSLMSRQGFLMAAEWTHRLPMGYYDVKASGLYQLDPSAFTFAPAQANWRGSIQTSGHFRPLADWKTGWSYTAFTDAAYLIDYDFRESENLVNEVYATYLVTDYYLDVRARQYNLLGNVSAASQAKQAVEIPRIEAASYHDLDEFGRLEFSANVYGVMRDADSYTSYAGVPYVFGYEERKLHATLEGAWQNQYVLPGGLVATPYLGGRVDSGYFTRSGAPLPAPFTTPAPDTSLLAATPIAAMDVRWPLIAVDGYTSYLFEPVAQLAYRGSSTSLTGITNDNAQSFVFDDTLLFSYDRFSGTDRQETGLRANLGARFVANFEDGNWLEFIAGQSFHLAGTNGLGVIDAAQTGNSSGLDTSASYIVASAQGTLGSLYYGGKLQYDPNAMRLMRGTVAANTRLDAYALGLAYTYIPANPPIGTTADQHEITGTVSGPIPGLDYWYADAGLSWDIATNQWVQANAGIRYDDGYLVAGVFGQVNGPTHASANVVSWGFRFRLRGPDSDWGM